ncbi:MAG: class GN sortase [Pseudomonadota bacterium]
MTHRLAFAAASLLLLLGGSQIGGGLWIYAKATLAQVLIKQAWANRLSGDGSDRPWPWADTAPVAQLAVPARGIDQIVLAGASGRTLAFGPGHMDGTAAPGEAGLAVITGHRDTHFRFLKDLAPGDELLLTDAAGARHRYRVSVGRVVDSTTTGLSLDGIAAQVALVTCYPFDAVNPGGPLRYVVFAEAVAQTPVLAKN